VAKQFPMLKLHSDLGSSCASSMSIMSGEKLKILSNVSGLSKKQRVGPDLEFAFNFPQLNMMNKNDAESIEDRVQSIESCSSNGGESDHDTEVDEFEFDAAKGINKLRIDRNASDTDEESVVSMSVSSQYTAPQMIQLAKKELSRRQLKPLDLSGLFT
jgi:hypothetical protein